MADFFISYNKADKAWAEWVAWILEDAGKSVIIQAWDFRPGQNFALEMQRAASQSNKTIAVLSQSYLYAEYTQPEWASAFAQDPKGKDRKLIPVRVDLCNLEGLQAPIIYIDLVGLSEQAARKAILEGLEERGKPSDPPGFPGANENKPDEKRAAPEFPGRKQDPASDIPWNVPQGVPYFTGRKDILEKLRKALVEDKTTALSQRQAIYGLGGIGKTQTAIAYADEYRQSYKAVLWVVAESKDSLNSEFVALAGVLNLPERNIPNQRHVVSAVITWLEENSDWLLILDNADDPSLLNEFLPSGSEGHVLLTSRSQVFQDIGILNPIEIEEMAPDDAKKFLLIRTGRYNITSDDDKAVEELAAELDYLPLALEQAGAYIKELRASFLDYLISYRNRGLELLEKGAQHSRARKSVRTTWSLNFQQVEESSRASADLLRVCAFLSPDRIPYELITFGRDDLGPEISSTLAKVESDPLIFDELLNPLIRYSLIHRDRQSRSYDIHRLVQAVLKEGLDDSVKFIWVECAINAAACVLPELDSNDVSMSERIERILPHAQICSELIETWNVKSLDAAQLLNKVGRYLHYRARLREAEAFYNRSLHIREGILGTTHPDVASVFHNLGWLRQNQGRYSEAEPLLRHSLSIREQTLSPDHLDISDSLYQLSLHAIELSKFAEAESLLARSLEIREKQLGPEHPKTVDIFLLQANIAAYLFKIPESEQLVIHSLEIIERTLGTEHPKLIHTLDILSYIYHSNGMLADAQAVILRAIEIGEKAYGANYPSIASSLDRLIQVYFAMGKHSEAEPLIVRALEIRERVLGPEHPDLARSFDSLARLREFQGRYAEAEGLYTQALTLNENHLGPVTFNVAESLHSLALFYNDRKKPYIGEPLIRRAISIRRTILGPNHSVVANSMFDHARILKAMNRKGEAQKTEAQAKKILAKQEKKAKGKK